MKGFVVVGLGNFGASVATALAQGEQRVAVVDVDRDKVERIAPVVERAVVGDATDKRVLERLEAGEDTIGIVSTGEDVTASVLSTLALRDCGVRDLYVKVSSTLHRRILEKIGVAETVFPEHDSAEQLARRVVSAAVINYVELGPGFSVQELAVPDDWVGKTLRELELPRRYRLTVIAIHDYLTGAIRPIPDPDATLKNSETLLVAGEDRTLAEIAASEG
jgi:trk system potassium uptake protein TrkA